MLLVNLQNLQHENGMLSMIKITQTMVKQLKMVQSLNFNPKPLNQFFVITQTHIFIAGDITAIGSVANTRLAFRSCAPFTKCITHINDEDVGANNFNIIMRMYNLIEYSDNYSGTSGSLWQFKRDELPVANAGNPDNASTVNSTSFK